MKCHSSTNVRIRYTTPVRPRKPCNILRMYVSTAVPGRPRLVGCDIRSAPTAVHPPIASISRSLVLVHISAVLSNLVSVRSVASCPSIHPYDALYVYLPITNERFLRTRMYIHTYIPSCIHIHIRIRVRIRTPPTSQAPQPHAWNPRASNDHNR